jgi:hypothetical protein
MMFALITACFLEDIWERHLLHALNAVLADTSGAVLHLCPIKFCVTSKLFLD